MRVYVRPTMKGTTRKKEANVSASRGSLWPANSTALLQPEISFKLSTKRVYAEALAAQLCMPVNAAVSVCRFQIRTFQLYSGLRVVLTNTLKHTI